MSVMPVPVANFGASVARTVARDKVYRLEAEALKLPQVNCPVDHFNAPGQMARRMFIPKGTVITGAIYKVEHLIVVASGRMQILAEDGSTREVAAGDVLVCKAGMKNAGFALEDTVWVNVYATDETDPAKLVELVSESRADELLGQPNNKQLAANKAAQLEA